MSCLINGNKWKYCSWKAVRTLKDVGGSVPKLFVRTQKDKSAYVLLGCSLWSLYGINATSWFSCPETEAGTTDHCETLQNHVVIKGIWIFFLNLNTVKRLSKVGWWYLWGSSQCPDMWDMSRCPVLWTPHRETGRHLHPFQPLSGCPPKERSSSPDPRLGQSAWWGGKKTSP